MLRRKASEKCQIFKLNKMSVFVIALLTFVIFVFVIPIIINELYKLNVGYLTLWDAADVLAFYAVVLSGIITIGALVTTIYFSKKDTEKQIILSKAQTKAPFFTIENINHTINGDFETDNGLIWKKEYIQNSKIPNQEKITITLRNIGDGIALSPYYQISILENEGKEVVPPFINKGDSLMLIYNLRDILNKKFDQSIFPTCFEPFNSNIVINYQNSLGIKFHQEIVFHHEYKVESNSIVLIVNSISPQNIGL